MVQDESKQRPNSRSFKQQPNGRSLQVIFMTIAAAISITMFNLSYCMLEHTTNLQADNNIGTIRNVDYSLAKEQSFGFFTDISNENWLIAQRYHSSLFPNYYADLQKYSNGIGDRGKVNNIRNSNMWYGQVSDIIY
jgi:hypothetical protein